MTTPLYISRVRTWESVEDPILREILMLAHYFPGKHETLTSDTRIPLNAIRQWGSRPNRTPSITRARRLLNAMGYDLKIVKLKND